MYHKVVHCDFVTTRNGDPQASHEEPGGPRSGSGRPRKERVLHTRISEQLAEDLRRIADDLRVPVSNLVRNALEEVFSVVETVTDNVGDLVEEVVEEAERVRERVRARRPQRAPDTQAQQRISQALVLFAGGDAEHIRTLDSHLIALHLN